MTKKTKPNPKGKISKAKRKAEKHFTLHLRNSGTRKEFFDEIEERNKPEREDVNQAAFRVMKAATKNR
jgi:hypothetical protein